MGNKCLTGCFVFYIVLSLLTHLAELVTNTMLAYFLWISVTTQESWFSLVMGILLIPLVLVQLLSAILLLNRRGDSLTTCEAIIMAFLHIIQMGFIWRHFTVLRERDVLVKKAEMAELFLLRLTFAFASGFPLMLVQCYLVLENISFPAYWILYLAAGSTLVSTTWALGSFRRQHETCDTENIVLTWPGSIFRLLWRAGEIAARIISLSLFATLYSQWLFLVIGLHWVTMLVCVCTSVFSAINESNGSKVYTISFRVLVAYMYIFAFINFSNQSSMFRYVMFYIIMFLENATLCLIWMVQDAAGEEGYRYLLVFITASCFFVAIVSLTIYYRFFHVSISDVPSDAKTLVCVKDSCINCKLSLCVKHKLKLQRPFSAGWYSQYNDAIYNGHYYKNLLQDSLLDSASEIDVKSIGTVRSGFYKPGTISEESNTSFIRDPDHLDVEKRSVVSFQSVGMYMHRRYISADEDILDDDDASSIPASLSPRRHDDHMLSESSLSVGSPRWIPPPGRSASQTCLLTDTWDSISQLNSDDHHPYPNLPSCRSLLRDDHNWYSDGYTTDNTLVWSKLPVTDLSRHRPVVSDSESEYYCRCPKTTQKKMAGVHSQRSKVNRQESLSESVKEKYMNWFRRPTALHTPNASEEERSVQGKCKSRKHGKRAPAWTLASTDKLVTESFEKWNKRIGAVPSPNPDGKHQAPLFDICDQIVQESLNEAQLKKEASVKPTYHNMGSTMANTGPQQGQFVKAKNKGRREARRVCQVTDSESETQSCVRPHRTRKTSHSPSSKISVSDCSVTGSKPQSDHLSTVDPHKKTIIIQSQTQVGVMNIRAMQNDKSKSSTDSGVGQPDYENDYVPMMSLLKCPSRSKKENIYENQAYIGDSDEVFLDNIVKVTNDRYRRQGKPMSDEVFVDNVLKITPEAPWYVCSESEDSALPQETFSSSNCGMTNSDNESDDSLELII
ncbi:LOW QUALITY PROTEIN: uncharacterized protein LOC124277360 [Haliotis rubra]|uniref:LOW QUALITY PROTEIN: uncharacterized protein LOC124277360 n=1 Tax=Haliotis rubra TaxID=36100 RepID=UPI001EE59BC1|nr:LOW QUALITY PROTEIN: uncharacterized protein LOC124277360 [Haliotis rubra]